MLNDNINVVHEVLSAPPEQTWFFSLGHFGVLELTGEEATDFLHKQLTNDVLHLAGDEARHAAWCSPKGRMLASVLVYKTESALRLLISRDLAEQTCQRLKMYILRSKVKALDISAQLGLLGLAGAGAESVLASIGIGVPAPNAHGPSCAHQDEVTVLRLNSGTEAVSWDRFILIAPAAQADTLSQKLSGLAAPAGITAWQALDILNGLPVITAATREAFVPQMIDFDRMGGVNFKKGCYPGQEVVSRAHYLGKVKRHLYRVTSSTPLNSGMELHAPESPDQSVGMVVSAVETAPGQWIGLASMLESASGNLIPAMETVRIFGEPAQ